MTYWLSRPIEVLLQEQGIQVTDIPLRPGDTPPAPDRLDGSRDVLIIGSGYGAAMAALALAEHDQSLPEAQRRRIHVFERGDEYLPDDFPKSLRDMPTRVGVITRPGEDGLAAQPPVNAQGLWDIRIGDHVTTVMGSGLGGTSLVNASVAARTPSEVFQHWPAPDFDTPGEPADWAGHLEAVYPKIEKLLGVSTLPAAETYPKYQALERSVKALGGTLAAAPLSINFEAPGVHSANHGPCNRCGNCVLGCHSGAKGSLNMNAWPLARQLGAELFTGVTVRSLQPAPAGGWQLECQLTRAPGRRFVVHATTVILGAGSVGSTEILLRSRHTHGLGLSDTLGQKFSANGDMLMFSAGQETPVHALATAPVADAPGDSPRVPGREAPGPTIIGKACVPLASDRSKGDITLEDGSVPYPLIALWQEMLVTQSFLRRYVNDADHAWQKANPDHDPLAVSADLATRSQVLLAMGVDAAAGELTLNRSRDAVLPSLFLEEDSYFDALHARLREAEKKAFDGGHYAPSLAWEPLPEGFGEEVAGAGELGRHVLTVHPLGGCAWEKRPKRESLTPVVACSAAGMALLCIPACMCWMAPSCQAPSARIPS
jgi:cholesterol oxidase